MREKIMSSGSIPADIKSITIINFMDYRTLAYDEDMRNKTFMKILNGKTL